ncbi:hypothetical protein NDU88_006033 [Pleurodeles waltl]|uniref:Uncharacterized protein n=1 Tax=Pleurodeles waltl TaxID=8319 RepID=A0AAV7MYE4_PLEWA|nr:hypothetical protein NDU88_006033 [Pleurodeles waltl]
MHCLRASTPPQNAQWRTVGAAGINLWGAGSFRPHLVPPSRDTSRVFPCSPSTGGHTGSSLLLRLGGPPRAAFSISRPKASLGPDQATACLLGTPPQHILLTLVCQRASQYRTHAPQLVYSRSGSSGILCRVHSSLASAAFEALQPARALRCIQSPYGTPPCFSQLLDAAGCLGTLAVKYAVAYCRMFQDNVVEKKRVRIYGAHILSTILPGHAPYL